MRISIFLLTLILSLSGRAEVDLGNLIIEGEVRRPMLRKIESKNATKKLLIEKAKDRLIQIEQNIYGRNLENLNVEEVSQNKKGDN